MTNPIPNLVNVTSARSARLATIHVVMESQTAPAPKPVDKTKE